MIEPSAIAILTAIMVPVIGGLLYIIRAEIRRNSQVTDATHEQVIPNHGTSLRDAVDRIERRITDVHDEVKAARQDFSGHLTWHLDRKD